MLDLEAIKARCEAATAGPWDVIGGQWVGQVCVYVGRRTRENLLPIADAEFAVAAREDVPELVAELETARALIKALEENAALAEERHEEEYNAVNRCVIRRDAELKRVKDAIKAHKAVPGLPGEIDAALYEVLGE
jgi:hypothetical protein